MKKPTEISGSPFSTTFIIFIVFISISFPSNANESWWEEGARPVVKRAHERTSLLKTEYGEISAVDFKDGSKFGNYHLQFITMEPNSLFLPVFLHADMVFYVHTGSGRLNWVDDNDLREVDLRRGNIYRLHPGSIFYLQSNLEPEREKFRIYALFSSTDDDSYDPSIGAYSSVTDLVRGFDKKLLCEAFKVSEDVIEELMNATKPPLIVHAAGRQREKWTSRSSSSSSSWELEARFLKGFFGVGAGGTGLNKKKKKGVYNVYEEDPDFENCNGWSLTVSKKAYHILKGSNVGLFVVNLTAGSMMGPHWNPRAWEIGIVTSEEPGVVQVGCSSTTKSPSCKNWRFILGKGDVFVVPRFYPMAQMSFNNGSFAFLGFSTTNRQNQPQFLGGSSSVLQIMDREVLAWSFDVNVTTIDRLLGARGESVILECMSCAEEEARKMEEEAEREEEEERRREEEERKRREEEEERRREEEERKRREEEEERKRREEEEERRREEEERKRREEEEERKRREEEERRREKEEEEKRKRREEEAERKRREEAERKRREEAERKRREEAERKRREEERKREEEEAKREEERRRKEGQERERQQEEARKREQKEQEPKEREKEEEEARKREQEKERKKQEQEQQREEARRREQEKERKKQEQEQQREEARRREQEKERKKQEQEQQREEARQREQEKEGEKQEREAGKREKEREKEEQEAIRQEQERKRQEQEEEPEMRILTH